MSKQLTINGSRINARNLRAHDSATHTNTESDVEVARTLADYAAVLRARRTSKDVITVRLDSETRSDKHGTESWLFQATHGKYSQRHGCYLGPFSYFFTVTVEEVSTARTWLEEHQ